MAIIGSLPNNLTNGTTADATQVMANFNTIVNAVNNATTGAASIPNVQAAIYNYAADTGSVNAILVTPTAPPAALTDGMQFRGKVANTNTSQTVTLAVGAIAAAGVVIDQAGTLPAIGSMISGMFYTWTWSASLSKWVLQNPSRATGSFTGTGTGFPATAPTCTITYRVTADFSLCTLVFGTGMSGTSNAPTFTITGMPAFLTPAQTQAYYITPEDNTAATTGSIIFTASSATITLGKSTSVGAGLSSWTSSGTKAFANSGISGNGSAITFLIN